MLRAPPRSSLLQSCAILSASPPPLRVPCVYLAFELKGKINFTVTSGRFGVGAGGDFISLK